MICRYQTHIPCAKYKKSFGGFYQIPINNGGTDIPVITPLAEPVSGIGQYVGQTAYPMGGAENNLESLINGASWMNAASYTNAAFGQNYDGRGIGNE